MRPIALFVFISLVAVAAANTLSQPGSPLVSGKNDADWQPLFATLASQGALRSSFTEHRWFPFRKEPVVLKGELRIAPGRGLSLRYLSPDDRLMVIDDAGLYLRNQDGRTRELPADQRIGAINQAVLPILRFDHVALARTFEIRAARSGEDWRLDFAPLDPALARTVGTIIAHGNAEQVRRLEFRRSAAQRVEIFIEQTEVHVAFDETELGRYFR